MGRRRNAERPTVEDGLTIGLGPIVRASARSGPKGAGTLEWLKDREQIASMGVAWDLSDPDHSHVTLTFTREGRDLSNKEVVQRIRLVCTVPNYGGQRWWMICPLSGRRVAKLHLPPGACEFASRKEWGLFYRSQRATNADRPFHKLAKLQRSLGSHEGWHFPLVRPKGMWKRTYNRRLERYRQLHAQCSPEMAKASARRERLEELLDEWADEPDADPPA
jgi:hypothetical protein